jgi:hypothetical protein
MKSQAAPDAQFNPHEPQLFTLGEAQRPPQQNPLSPASKLAHRWLSLPAVQLGRMQRS